MNKGVILFDACEYVHEIAEALPLVASDAAVASIGPKSKEDYFSSAYFITSGDIENRMMLAEAGLRRV